MMSKRTKAGTRKNITDRVLEHLQFIKDHIALEGYPPTVREIAWHFGLKSTNGVHETLHILRENGYIDWMDGKSRTIRVFPIDSQ